jgi:hypothetical protein
VGGGEKTADSLRKALQELSANKPLRFQRNAENNSARHSWRAKKPPMTCEHLPDVRNTEPAAPRHPGMARCTRRDGNRSSPKALQELSAAKPSPVSQKAPEAATNPAVFTGSCNLADGGERANGDNLIAIYDRAIATMYGVEAIRLVDHLSFRAFMHKAKAKPLALRSNKENWWAPYYDKKNLKYTERRLFVK